MTGQRRAVGWMIALAACASTDAPSDGSSEGSSDASASEGSSTGEPACTPDAGLELYERRIAPLLADDRSSTCNQCHLSGIDLSLYVQATPCETMACMVDQGIVDLEAPDASVVLAWIERATPSGGITEQTIASERQAMLDWIEMAAACDGELCEPVEEPCGQAPDHTDCEIPPAAAEPIPLDDPGDCSDATLELVWREKVYEWRGRCFPCHFDSQAGRFEELDPPPWIATGECNPASLATLRNAEEAGYLDRDEPLKSLLITKPLDESLGGVEHGGGPKIHTLEDPTYLDFAHFVQRWADCQ